MFLLSGFPICVALPLSTGDNHYDMLHLIVFLLVLLGEIEYLYIYIEIYRLFIIYEIGTILSCCVVRGENKN